MTNVPCPHHASALRLTVDELEEVVEDEVRTTIGHQLERLGVVHGAFLIVDLGTQDSPVSQEELLQWS